MKKTFRSELPLRFGGCGKEEEEVSRGCPCGEEKSNAEREDWRGLLALALDEAAAWRAVRGARSASMSKPGKSIEGMNQGCCGTGGRGLLSLYVKSNLGAYFRGTRAGNLWIPSSSFNFLKCGFPILNPGVKSY